MRGVTGVRCRPKKKVDFSGRGSPPGEHTSCYVIAQLVQGLEKFRGEDIASGGESIEDWLKQLK